MVIQTLAHREAPVEAKVEAEAVAEIDRGDV